MIKGVLSINTNNQICCNNFDFINSLTLFIRHVIIPNGCLHGESVPKYTVVINTLTSLMVILECSQRSVVLIDAAGVGVTHNDAVGCLLFIS